MKKVFVSSEKKRKFTFMRFVKKPRTEMTINIPMKSKDIYC